jgi:uncharacterized protein (UPF0335 family)
MDETKLAELIRSVVSNELQTLNTDINTRFDKLDERIEGVESELKIMNDNITNVLLECRRYTKQVENV